MNELPPRRTDLRAVYYVPDPFAVEARRLRERFGEDPPEPPRSFGDALLRVGKVSDAEDLLRALGGKRLPSGR